MSDLALSVVIPTFNRARYLRRTLAALGKQDLASSRFEVIVVDDGSSDQTQAVLRERQTFVLRSVRQVNGGPASARNLGIELARCDLIVFIDDDVIATPNLLARHLEAQRTDAGVVIGRMEAPENVAQPIWAAWELRALNKQYRDMAAGRWSATPRQFYTANASVPREALQRAGGFNEHFRRAEDVELGYRLSDVGLTFRFDASAVVVHDTPRSLDAWLRMAGEYGRYDVEMWRDYGRKHILGCMAHELEYERHRLLRGTVRTLVGRRLLTAALRATAKPAVLVSGRNPTRRAGLAICSAIFNLLYWDAACKAFGGRTAFLAALAEELHPPVAGQVTTG